MKEKKKEIFNKMNKTKFQGQRKKGCLGPSIRLGKDLSFRFPYFLGNLNPEELIEWINELEEYFE